MTCSICGDPIEEPRPCGGAVCASLRCRATHADTIIHYVIDQRRTCIR